MASARANRRSDERRILLHNDRGDIRRSYLSPCSTRRACAGIAQHGGDDGPAHRSTQGALVSISALILIVRSVGCSRSRRIGGARPSFVGFGASGNRPATTHSVIDGVSAAILPNGRLVTPAGVEVDVQAPKPFGLALSPDGSMAATLNSGAAPFSVTLISQLTSQSPAVKRINVNASFMGVTFSPDSTRLYLSGGENGNIWVGDAVAGQIIGSVNLNGATHPLDRPSTWWQRRHSVSRVRPGDWPDGDGRFSTLSIRRASRCTWSM